MLQDLMGLLVQVMFWVKVLGGCLIWYLLALFLSRLFFGSGGDAVNAARSGALVALIPAPILVAVLAWFLWHEAALMLALTLLTVVIPLLLTMLLAVLEPARGRA